MNISVYIIAFNEAEKISDCINSVLWADEIIVADSHSTDGTSEIAEEMGAKVVHIPFNGYGDLRNQAISYCKSDWIFSLDSDERCTTEVRDEILDLIENAPFTHCLASDLCGQTFYGFLGRGNRREYSLLDFGRAWRIK